MRYAVPASILMGSVIIAIGLYLGLRERAAPPHTAAPAAPAVPARAQNLAEPLDVKEQSPAPTVTVAAEAPSRAAPDAPLGEDPPPTAATPALSPTAPAVQEPARQTATALAAEALAAAKPGFVESCWTPLVAVTPEPATAVFDFDVTFDGTTGRAIARGISEPRSASRGDVGECLRRLPLDLQIEPQGVNIGVQVRLTLP